MLGTISEDTADSNWDSDLNNLGPILALSIHVVNLYSLTRLGTFLLKCI